MRYYELEPLKRKSFHGKAKVREDDTDIGKMSYLKSYDTIVASYNHTTKNMVVRGYFSPTTMRHINAFLNHFGLPTHNKKSLLETYIKH